MLSALDVYPLWKVEKTTRYAAWKKAGQIVVPHSKPRIFFGKQMEMLRILFSLIRGDKHHWNQSQQYQAREPRLAQDYLSFCHHILKSSSQDLDFYLEKLPWSIFPVDELRCSPYADRILMSTRRWAGIPTPYPNKQVERNHEKQTSITGSSSDSLFLFLLILSK